MLNLKPFFAALDNDTESINLILTTYIEEYSDSDVIFKNLFDAQNWEELYIVAHSLKGILGNFGADEIIPILEKIEMQSQDGKPTDQKLINNVSILLVEIQNQIEKKLSETA